MSEIKFRAWNTSKEMMHSAEEMGIDQEALLPDGRGFANISSANTRLTEIHSHLIPLQYTGLKDKNGKEIYEGDLLRISIEGCEQAHPYTVKDLRTFFEALDTLDSYLRIQENTLEVIGNIYENKELLETKCKAKKN